MIDGYQGTDRKSERFYAWAVSDGDITTIPEAQTYALMLAGLGLMSVAARRRKPAR